MKTTNELIIFDWDDTLMQTIALLRDALHTVLYEHVRDNFEPTLTREDFDTQSDAFYKETKSTISNWGKKHNQSNDFTKIILKLASLPMVNAVMVATKRNEARLARLRQLKSLGYTMVILTHNDRDFCLPLINEFGYAEFFPPEHVYDFSLVGHYKTTPDAYHFVLNDLNQTFDAIHMVEDTDINLKCAKELGMETHHILGEYPLSPAAKAYTDNAFASIDDFLETMIRRAA